MESKEMVKELRRLEEKHKNDKICTGDNNWSKMCHDVANKIEEQDETISKMKEQIYQLEAIKIGGEEIKLSNTSSSINFYDLVLEQGMKKYAIWSNNHEVIGYVNLTEEQAKEMNQRNDIGMYFGFDNLTNPEKYDN